MLRRSYKPFFLLSCVILFLMSLSEPAALALRGSAVACFSPCWSGVYRIKALLAQTVNFFSPLEEKGEELQLLRIKNQCLQQEITRLEELLQQEYLLEAKLLLAQGALQELEEGDAFFKRRREELKNILSLQIQAIPAEVIFRGISLWNSSLWVNVGSEENKKLGREVIAKNSPVVVGLSLVGVVDYVGKHQSRVRLITDAGLRPSVRASRGYVQNQHLAWHIDSLLASLRVREDLFANRTDNEILIQNLEILQSRIKKTSEKWLLAKGELHGGSLPLWRSNGQLLQGVGFNYDFEDEEGPSRDLRTGKPYLSLDDALSVPLLKVNDLLVTTGMDGVFPPGLHVAEVVHIDTLKEGSYTYELIAKPTAGHLDNLATVFVLPPVGYDASDQPRP